MRAAAVFVILAPIRLWSRVISPALPPRCRYYPSCSRYAEEAVRVHGPLHGLGLAAWRLVRCNPFSPGGVDEVPPPRGHAEPTAAAGHAHRHGHA